eukprot:6826230-Pyramimonas_sp.AAC.1
MALVFKDFNRAVHRIDCIPIGTVDKIKEWLNRAGANRGPVNSMYPEREPIAGRSIAYTQGESQSRAGR